MSERDPKLNPRAGDVLRKGNQTRMVVGMDNWLVVFTNNQGNKRWTGIWQKWARTAEVVRAEEE
jgi:hypothetical protein